MTTFGNVTLLNFPSFRDALVYKPFGSLYTTTWKFDTESLSLAVLPKGWEFEKGRNLNSILLVQLRMNRNGVLATTFLEAEEYGWGNTESEAIIDLISSLVEYMESLEARQDRLAEPGLADLQKLRQLFQREPG